MNCVTKTGGLFEWIRKCIEESWKFFARETLDEADQKSISTSSAKFRLPLKSGEIVRVGLAVMAIDLDRSE